MEVVITKDSLSASAKAADLVAKAVRSKPDSVLGLATGGTPLELYKRLINMHKNEGLDFSKVKTFNLDEYIVLKPEDRQSYNYFMRENFFSHVNIPDENINIPDGMTANIPSFCKEYEEKIKRAGGIDLQILGIGSDGHIGFNEPTSSLASRTRIKTLTQKTVCDNARFFGGDKSLVPLHVITMGIGTIMDAKTIVLLAFGKNKAEAVAKMIEGPITSMVPASALQFHPRTKVFIDRDASEKLVNTSYYDWVFERKPEWQKDI